MHKKQNFRIIHENIVVPTLRITSFCEVYILDVILMLLI